MQIEKATIKNFKGNRTDLPVLRRKGICTDSPGIEKNFFHHKT